MQLPGQGAALAISAHEVTGSTVNTLFHLADGFFMAAELLAILPACPCGCW
jgi:hypothetical protein